MYYWAINSRVWFFTSMCVMSFMNGFWSFFFTLVTSLLGESSLGLHAYLCTIVDITNNSKRRIELKLLNIVAQHRCSWEILGEMEVCHLAWKYLLVYIGYDSVYHSYMYIVYPVWDLWFSIVAAMSYFLGIFYFNMPWT